MHVCVGMKRTTLMKKDLEISWKVAYELRNEIDLITTHQGNWNGAAHPAPRVGKKK